MDTIGRALLDQGIKDYLLKQLRKEFGDDFRLVSHRVDFLISSYTLKDLRWAMRREIELARQSGDENADQQEREIPT